MSSENKDVEESGEEIAARFEPKYLMLSNKEELFALSYYHPDHEIFYLMDTMSITKFVENERLVMAIRPWLMHTDDRVVAIESYNVMTVCDMSKSSLDSYLVNRKKFFSVDEEMESMAIDMGDGEESEVIEPTDSTMIVPETKRLH